MTFSKIIVLVTNNNLVKTSIEDHLNSFVFSFIDSVSVSFDRVSDTRDSLLKYHKIDLLIVCSDNFDLSEPYKVKNVINISNKILSDEEIKLSKPFKLSNLLSLIYTNIVNNSGIFCAIGDFIYDERSQFLKSKQGSIKFTEKEHEIFKTILVSKNCKVKKSLLLKNILRYHKDTESSTLETHLYKLKAKLPDNMLKINDNICSLNIVNSLIVF